MEILVEPASVRSLLLEVMANDRPLGTATGFIVVHESRPYLVTNYHVAAGRNPTDGQPEHRSGATPDTLRFRVVRPSDEKLEFQILVEPTLDDEGAARWLEHPVYGRRVDVVALPLSVSMGLGFDSYKLIDIPATYLRPGSGVSIVGFPFGLTGGGAFGIWTHGFVASEPRVDLDDLPKFLVDARTRRGQSGSPVIGGRYALLGIYSGRVNEESDLGIVWKVNALREILEGQAPGHAGL